MKFKESLYDLCIRDRDKTYLLSEWDYEKNVIRPNEISISSDVRIYWKCNKGHSWQTKVDHRVRVGSGCPYCANHKLLVGFNDLETWSRNNGFDYLLEEWHYEKNENLKPNAVMYCSNRRVNWKCSKCGGEWEIGITNRTGEKHSGCPHCHHRGTSFFEQALTYYLKKHFNNVKNRYKINEIELDIFIPKLKVAIEYDGNFYHKNRVDKDIEKNKKCLENGISLIRIREKGLNKLDNCICIMRDRNERCYFNDTILKLFSLLKINDKNIDIERDYIEILNKYRMLELENSIAMTHPDIAKEWNYEKNGKLNPKYFTSGSNEVVWWKCSNCKEDYESSINHRTSGSACPYCSNRKIKVGFNDFETWCYDNGKELLLEEWDYSKNKKKPNEYFAGTLTKVWWKCKKCGHEWEAPINNRSRGRGCARCAGKYGGSRAVLCVETGEIFDTPIIAAKSMGKKDASYIRSCCAGKFETAYGYHWKYLED